MMRAEPIRSLSARDLHYELQKLYAAYAECIDDGDLEQWPEFFTEACLYKIVPRENYDRNLPLAIWLSESKGMLKDRVVTIRQTSMYAPRYMRHLISGISARDWQGDVLAVQANYLVLETLMNEFTRVFNAGRYIDQIVVENDRLKFKQKLCVFDSVIVPNTLVFPI
ncbi:MAG: aromatic-ring-hydroxylating dioxygenase subunit beta [Burkholderiales bacterium]|nr:aromatic-ring-hydroxylating dioxygenase subunit beta [Burkholderiales bacterium]